MIPENFEHVLVVGEYNFYKFEEIGFSNGKLALQHMLYQNFGPGYDSRYHLIFKKREHTEQKISQIWIFKNDVPIGLGLAVHEDEPYYIKDEESGFKSFCLGHLQLYISPQHRGKKLAAHMVPLLESMVFNDGTYYPPSVIMQDDAYPFSKYLKNTIAVPYPKDSEEREHNALYLFKAFKDIVLSNENHYIYKNYPEFLVATSSTNNQFSNNIKIKK